MAKFLKDSEDRLTSLKRHTESKRGGRGAKRGLTCCLILTE